MTATCILHPTALRPWQPLTDAEFAVLKPFLPPEEGRGRPANRRKTVNAIFWIAASREPWRALPDTYGKPDSVAKALRRWARAGILDRLLVAVSDPPLSSQDALLSKLTWLICRAFRRMARILPEASVRRAEALGLRTAWPAPVLIWPNPPLGRAANAAFLIAAERIIATPRQRKLLRLTIRMYGHCIKLGRYAAGNRSAWRLK